MTASKKRASKLEDEKLKNPTTIRLPNAYEKILVESVKVFGLSKSTMARMFCLYGLMKWNDDGRNKNFFDDLKEAL
jgi:hypothetical protein